MSEPFSTAHSKKLLGRHLQRSTIPALMRIVSIRIEPVARVMAISYAAFGLFGFLLSGVTGATYLTLPIGIVAPFFHLNINFTLALSSDVASITYACLATILCYAATGWLTGAALALLFNASAKQMGGIDAKYVMADNSGGINMQPFATPELSAPPKSGE